MATQIVSTRSTSQACERCQGRSHWEFLKDFFRREETAWNCARTYEQMLQQAVANAQNDKIAIINLNSHLQQLQNLLNEAREAQARCGKELQAERMERIALQELYTAEKENHSESCEELLRVRRTLEHVDELVDMMRLEEDSNLQLDDRSRTVTEIVLGIKAKEDQFDRMEKAFRAEMKQKLDEKAKILYDKDRQIYELQKMLQEERWDRHKETIKTMVGSATRGGRRRQPRRGRNRTRRESSESKQSDDQSGPRAEEHPAFS
ncbi:MAG: hypothetical protein M1834_004256 [Cirrosporium novae-zelandiae]|nr:MAG: hypothetical protein M1834_004256 [Cirrosporium novae-zelandiae]